MDHFWHELAELALKLQDAGYDVIDEDSRPSELADELVAMLCDNEASRAAIDDAIRDRKERDRLLVEEYKNRKAELP
jgi:cobalamin biosynthesis Mg chelatase CobN